MSKPFDLLIVGAGFFGAVCAYELKRKGFRCLLLEKRGHIGGNCFTEKRDDINIHSYGPHIFHTSDPEVWNWVNQFASFNRYRHRVKVCSDGLAYSFPLNLMTFQQLWGVATPEEARKKLEGLQVHGDTQSLEGWMLSKVGREVYEKFFAGYTRKQWGRSPATLPASIIKRLPIRFSYDDDYYEDSYQGIPTGGYTGIFTKLLSGIEVRLNTDYFAARHHFDSLARKVLYTGPIDRFYDYQCGRLEYRSMKFEHQRIEMKNFQGVAQINYPSETVPYTRIIEHKHFEFGTQPVTWITREYPGNLEQEPMYPVKDAASQGILKKYHHLQSREQKHYFGGRLASYEYYDMHHVIAAALKTAKNIISGLVADKKAGQNPNHISHLISEEKPAGNHVKKTRKNLVVVRAGDGSLHPKWLDAGRERNFDIFVSYFGNTPGRYRDEADYYEHIAGLKWPPIAKLFQTQRDFLSGYDACWFPDDDLLIDGFGINNMFDLFHEHDLWLAQPALAGTSHFTYPLTKQVHDAPLRFTNFVEIMCPLFNRHALAVLGPTFGSSISGWGLDFVWPHLLGYPENRVAILDGTPVIHTRPVKSGSFYKHCANLGVDPEAELRQLLEKYGIGLQQPRVIKSSHTNGRFE